MTLPHLQLRLLAQLCKDTNASQAAVLEQARRALEYGATPAQLELVAGHWPAAEDVRLNPYQGDPP